MSYGGDIYIDFYATKLLLAGHSSRVVFARSEAGIVGLNPTQGMDVWSVYVFILCLCCPVFRQRPCDELITRPRSHTVCNMIMKLKSWGQGPKGAVELVRKKELLLLTDFVGRLCLIKIHQTFRTNSIHTLHLLVQGGSYLCWPVHCSALHGDGCTTGCQAHMNCADESICLLADNVQNEVVINHKSQEVLNAVPVNCGLISPSTTDCRKQLQKWTLPAGSRGCKAWISVVL
jgi:hypothetical protein